MTGEKHYYIWTVGCQMNVSDSMRVAGALEEAGYKPSEKAEGADVVVLNTCSVRQAAEEKTFGKIGELSEIKRRKPGMLVAMIGCMVPADHTALKRKLPAVDHFFRPQMLDELLDALDIHDLVGNSNEHFWLPDGDVPVSAHVPIIYGCNKVCTYCIVPYRRGKERSRPIPEIVREVVSLVERGVREVNLLGQNVDSYGHDLLDKPDLADLLTALDKIPALDRIRFLTSHPRDMTTRLVDAVADLPKACEHINLPVQSGDDEILRRMRRGYKADEYREKIAYIRQRVPHVSVATDIIVGYPGEGEEEFQRTYDLLAELRLDVVHVAMYSPRPGTAAFKLEDDVPHEVKHARLQKIEQLQAEVSASFNAQYLDQVVEVLVEGRQKGRLQGRTRTNKLVFFDGQDRLIGQLVNIHVTKTTAWSMQGEVEIGTAATNAGAPVLLNV